MLRFDTTPYEASHQQTPRGRGSWAFTTVRQYAMEDVVFSPGGMLYSEAKKWAKQHFAGARGVYVLP
jgi:hypothetical protein